MKRILKLLILLTAATSVQAQGWRGIVPLRSGCAAVKEKLGITECKNRSYDVADARRTSLAKCSSDARDRT